LHPDAKRVLRGKKRLIKVDTRGILQASKQREWHSRRCASVSILAARARVSSSSIPCANEKLIVGQTIFPLDPIRRRASDDPSAPESPSETAKKNSETNGPGIVGDHNTVERSTLYGNFVIVCKSGKLEIIQFSCTEVSVGLRFHNYVNRIDKAAAAAAAANALNNLFGHFVTGDRRVFPQL